MKIDLTDCVESLVNIADYLLALQGKKAQCNTIDSVESLSNNELKTFSNVITELEINLEGALSDIINLLLHSHGLIDNDEEEEKEFYYDELYQLIMEKGNFGYTELLKICNMQHLEFCKIEK